MIYIIWSIILYVYTSLQYNFMEQLGPLLIEFLYFVAFYRNIFFNVFYVCYSFSKTVNAWYNVLELATIYVHLCNCQVKVKYWGNVRWCPQDDFSTTEVYICIGLNRNPSFNTCPKGTTYHIHKRGGDMFPLMIYTGHINYCFYPPSTQFCIDAYYSVNQSILNASDLSGDGGSI